MSSLFIGPRAGSYRPPADGVFVLSSRTGLTICFTEIFLISSEERKEKDVEPMCDDIALVTSILSKRGWLPAK